MTSLAEIPKWKVWRIRSIFNTKNTSAKDQMVNMHNLKLTDYMENQTQPKFLGCSLNLPSLVFKWKWRNVLGEGGGNDTSKPYSRNTIVRMCYSQYPRPIISINLFNNNTTKRENIYGVRSRNVTTFKYWRNHNHTADLISLPELMWHCYLVQKYCQWKDEVVHC